MTTTEVDNDETTLKKKNDFSLFEEAIKLFHVGLPSVAVQFELYFVFPLAASKVGRLLGTTELAAFSLGSLIGNLTCLSVIVGALTAADTLMPRAYGAENYEEIGRLAVRSVFVCSLLLVPAVVILSQPAIVEFLLQSLRQDEEVSRLTALWMQWFLIGTPANMMFRVIQRFLVAQHKPLPPVYAAFLPSFVIHPLLLSLLVPTMGLTGSALAIACTQWLMLLFLLAFLKVRPVYEKASWPGLSIAFLKDSLMRPRPLFKFLHLGMGGVLSMNEWFFWEVMCFSAGVFGVVELCAHTIAYNIIPLCFMVPLGMSIGLTVRMGSVITNDVDRAKRIAAWTLAFIAFLGAVLGFCLHTFAEPIILLFTNDDAVLQMAKSIWGRVCYYIFVLYIFGINCAILRGKMERMLLCH